MNPGPINPPIALGEFVQDLNGLKLWYKVSGRGPVCILPTPGWGASAELYVDSIQPLEEHFTMVYLEMRGTGRSEAPSTRSEYTWDHFSADLEALRMHLHQEQIWLAGHSQGGMLVMHYAISYRDRVRGMLVIDSAPGFDAEMLNDAITRASQHGYGDILAREFDSQLFHPPATEKEYQKLLSEDKPIFYWHNVTNAEKYGGQFASVKLALHPWQGCAYSHQSAYDFVSNLPAIKAPALIIVGASDIVAPITQSERLHHGIRNSKLLVIEKAGHFPWIEAREAFFDGVRSFLPEIGYVH